MSAYGDFFQLLQGQQQNTRLDNPYGAASYALSNAVQGYLMGKDRKQKRDASEALAAAIMTPAQQGQGGNLLSGQVAGMGARMGLPDYEGVKRSLASLKGNPYATDMLVQLGMGDIEDAGKTRNKMALVGYTGEVEKDVYRDRRGADAGYASHEFGLRGQLSDQEYKQRVDEYQRKSGLDLRNLREDHSLSNERTLNQIGASLGADLTRLGAEDQSYERRGNQDLTRAKDLYGYQTGQDIWEHGAKAGIDTEHANLRGESDLDRQRREYGYQADASVDEYGRKKAIDVQNYDALNPETFSQAQEVIGPDGKALMVQVGNRGTIRPMNQYQPYEKELALGQDGGMAATSFFESKGIEGDVARVLTSVGPKVAAGVPVSPQEQMAFNFALSTATQPKTIEVDGQLVTIPAMTQDQIFQGIQMGIPQAQPVAQQQAPRQWGPRVSAAEARQSGPSMERGSPYAVPLDVVVPALITRESGGKANARSHVGARGLMQVMPQTAEDMARELGMNGFKQNWLDDPEVNRKLGTHYLKKMLDEFGGNLPMALAAYNAGPGAVNRWRKTNGDPLKGEISVREFIARIPYKETRNYVPAIMDDIARTSGGQNVSSMPVPQQQQGMPNRGAPVLPQQINVPVPPAQIPQAPPAPAPIAQPSGLPPGASVYQVPPSEKSKLELEKERALATKAQAETVKVQTEAQDLDAARAKKNELLAATNRRLGTIKATLGNEDASVGGWSGAVSSYVPGTEAHNLKYEIAAVKNQFTGANLDLMKGILSDTDIAILSGLAGSLDISMPRDQQLKTIDDMQKIMNAGQPQSPAALPATPEPVTPKEQFGSQGTWGGDMDAEFNDRAKKYGF